MRPLFACALAAATGCTMDVGAGQVAPVAFDEPIEAAAMPPPISLAVEVEFLSADQADQMNRQFGSKLGAVDAVDLEVQAIGLVDADGNALAGTTMSLQLGAVTIDHVGQRVRLPTDLKNQLLDAIRQRRALDVEVHLLCDWPAPMEPTDAHALLQPIVVVNELQAL